MLKTYKCTKFNEAVFNVRINKFSFRVAFTGGSCFDGFAATYSTSNALEQLAIEHDPRYGKDFKLVSSVPEPGDPLVIDGAPEKNYGKDLIPECSAAADDVQDVRNDDSVAVTEYAEVDTVNDMVAILKKKGVHYTRLRSKPDIKAAAEELGLSFPNVKL